MGCARKRAYEMRHDKTDEADDAAGRDKDTRQQREESHVEAALCTCVDAERYGKLLTEEQHVERAQLGEKVDGERGDDEDGQEKAVPLRVGKTAHRPERSRLHALRIRRHVDDEVRRRDAQSADRCAREHKLYR